MGLSVASLRPISSISYTAATPMNYAVDNEADVSSVYTESMKAPSAAKGVTGAAPVIYPNAQEITVDSVSRKQATAEMSRAYNDIASSFGGTTTSYGASSQAISYSSVGSNFDAFA